MASTKQSTKPEAIANRSGFPLQLAVRHLVENEETEFGWQVCYSEHAWKHPLTGNAGFCDLVLEDSHQTSVLNIECKRVRESCWVFLLPKENPNKRLHVKGWVSNIEFQQPEPKFFNWADLVCEAASHESGFCAVDGHDPKSKPMLERVASEVVLSTESLANYELESGVTAGTGLRMYFNVIITTAELRVLNFDPSHISLESGDIAKSESHVVPYLRFRKQLTTHQTPPKLSIDYRQHAKVNESTVFVVNSLRFKEFLDEFTITNESLSRVLRNEG